jgi:serine/threonine-protein kinase RsbW
MKIQEKFLAKIEQLPKVIASLGQITDKCSLSPKKKLEVELVVEELFVNVCEHAYTESPGNAEITILCDNGVEVVIRDWGRPFNPLEHKVENRKGVTLEEQELGGLGIHLVMELVDQITYTREEGANCTTLRIT